MARAAATASGTVHGLIDPESSRARTDEYLLQRFVSRSDESAETAFATLVERYGPIVHRVCLSVLGNPHETQDAAQAVFLVLARKARSIRKPGSLGPWLHGVAVRVARRAKCAEARRRVAERRKAEMMHELDSAESGPEPIDYSELHEEIDRLPEKYRFPIILCYMQGQTQTQAARTLRWPLGTVQIRLYRGRERLRSRLIRRGAGLIALTSSDLTTSLSLTRGSLEREWTETTARAAVRFAVGKGTAGLVAPPVSGLAETVLAAMLGDSLKLGALIAISFLLVLGGIRLTGLSTDKPRLEVSHLEPKPAPAPVIKPEPRTRAPSVKPLLRIVDKKDPTAESGVDIEEKPRTVERAEVSSESSTMLTPPPIDHSDSGGAPPTSAPSPGRFLSLGVVAKPSEKTLRTGRELFERLWVKNDQRAHGGDGLGPVFNGQSCVACHHLGGSGGAGTVDTNIEIATVSGTLSEGTGYSYSFSMDFSAGRFEYRLGGDSKAQLGRPRQSDATLLTGIHPGFRDANSIVLHRYGTDSAYHAWRGSVPGRHGSVLIQISQRNPPPLFGAGLIDAISDLAIEAAARRKSPGSAQVNGRVSRLKDGRVGRFGWKAQTATLGDFVRSAAAGEIGLEIPGRHQAADPRLPGLAATGLDMDESECDALVEYVRSLPVPVASKPADQKHSAQVKAGEATFKSIGCTVCHMPKLGEVSGIYSDLLLHDMGPQLADADAYTVFVGDPSRADGLPVAGRVRADRGASSVREWRTPPLWGIRDSGPYMHDGRAASIAQAIALHAGQGGTAARRYAELSPRRKQQIDAFLLSLGPPAADR
ncbi:MAG: sigma-70 family RNA polymerase sigma factor [Isosphaerales bacterium]